MLIPLSWLLEYAPLAEPVDPVDVARRLTAVGLEIEGLEHVGQDVSGVVVAKVLESKSDSYGFDAQNEVYTDLVTAGIIDPTKVVRTALQDASSVAGLLVTTEAMVAERPKKDAAPAMPGGGGMGGMGDMDF